MKIPPGSVGANQVACEHYEQTFGRPPKGIWLPECAYYEGLERMLADVGLRYFLTDGHGILYARPRPLLVAAMLFFTETGVAFWSRSGIFSASVVLKWVTGAPEYQEFTKTWVGKRNMSTSCLISCPMVSEKHRY